VNYMISRNGQEYGPYSLADLQWYVSSGDVLLTDMARSEGMTGFLPVSQVIGSIRVPVKAPAVSLAPAGPEYPDPPNLNWGLVLLFEVLTCGLFSAAWGLVLAVWVKKVSPQSKSMYFYGGECVCLGIIFVLSFIDGLNHTKSPFMSLMQIIIFIVSLVARYSLRNSLEDHYNHAEPMGLGLSGVMTFFFATIYFQYHLNDINRRKRLDRLSLSAI
jgi:hypothetical protein